MMINIVMATTNMDSGKNLQQEKKAWRELKYHQKLLNAFRGVYIFIATTKNLLIYTLCSLGIIILGFYFHLSNPEWISIVFAIGLLFIAEAFNTAIEIDIDLTSPEYHPYARDTKDVAAGAVLLSGIVAVIVILFVFLPKIF